MNGEIREKREVIREEMFMRDKIINVLKECPKTVPEIAEALGCPSHEVMIWVMGMRKYGYVAETEEATNNGFYKYKVAVREGN
ncbi:transcriptional regulator [Desulfolucanica intricata]|uniref:transcriptional regulator n=1 Tax=Desulfolucanica intricata TaxID=1285191 RepID=UPI0008360F97|nr:transcriptional regulator [Desulfolucanica intricata]